MVGTSIGSPPSAVTNQKILWPVPGRVSRIRFPNSWLRFKPIQLRPSNRTTSPTTMTVGGSIWAASAFRHNIIQGAHNGLLIGIRVPNGSPQPASWTVLPFFDSNCLTIAGRFFIPIINTSVPMHCANLVHSKAVSVLVGSSWPVTNVTVDANVRWVTGMPA